MDWMPWQTALKVAFALLAVGVVWRPSGRRARVVTALCREAALVMGLYALWFYLGVIGRTRVDGAMSRGQDIWDVQQALHFPSEATIQGWFLGHDAIVQFFNRYYGWVHVPALVVFLVWLFLRHRDQYPTWRTSLALLTLACFVIQLMPTAPPRLFPELGIVDTGQLYGESVYGAIQDPGPAQLSAFPSVHVAWAVLIAWGAWSVSTSRWRWLGVGHALMTTLVVVATGNHWWLDGLAALAILIVIRAAVPPARSLAAALPRVSFRRPGVAPGVALARSDAGESPDG